MKILNFTAVEVLPSLLNRSKAQTIELAKTDKPRFTIGQKVKIIWNQRKEYYEFCFGCGKSLEYDLLESIDGLDGIEREKMIKRILPCGHRKIFRNSYFKRVVITKVFRMEIGKIEGKPYLNIFDKEKLGIKVTLSFVDELSKLDGFNSKEQMFKYLDKHYDLSQSKKFWVYRWRWLK